MPKTTLDLFGGICVRSGPARTVQSFRTRKGAALVGYLAVESRNRHSRDALSELLWGDVPPAQAHHSLRQALLETRAILGNVVMTPENTIALDLDRVRVDVHCFERHLASGSMRALRTVCGLYRGDLLAGLTVAEVAFDVWQANQRIRLRQLAIEAHERYATALMEAGNSSAAIAVTLRLLSIEPLHEWAHQTLITLYARRCQFRAAVQQYELLARVLRGELGIEPDLKTQDLLRALIKSRRRP